MAERAVQEGELILWSRKGGRRHFICTQTTNFRLFFKQAKIKENIMDTVQWAVFREFLHGWVEKNAKEFPAIARAKGIALAKRLIDEALTEWRAAREKTE